jgi:hypothetical protein
MVKESTERARQLIAIGLSGIGLGWLTGLSASPVISIVLTSVFAVATGVITALSSIDQPKDGQTKGPLHRADAWPVAVLLLAIVFGSMVGIRARVNEWIGDSPSRIARRWRSEGLPLSTDAIVKQLFEEQHGVTSPSAGNKEQRAGDRADKPYLFAISQTVCDTLRAKEGGLLRYEMQHSGNPQLIEFAMRVDNPVALKAAVETLVCPNPSSSH